MPFPVTVNVLPVPIRLAALLGHPYSKVVPPIKKEIVRELNIQKRMFERTTRTWRHKPDFHIDIKFTGDSIEGSVWTDDEIYFYIDRGTSVRHALMRREFRPKTTPFIIGSRRGAFPDPVAVRRSINRPGIEARHFSDEIYERRKDIFYNNVRKIMRRNVWGGTW